MRLERIPHFTTPNKFLKRVSPSWFFILLRRLTALFNSKCHVVLGATGIRQSSASYSYIKRIGRNLRKQDFFKMILAVDLEDGFILSCRGAHGNKHESPYFVPLLQDIRAKLIDVCGDKAFDSEKNHSYVSKERNAKSYIDVHAIPKRGRYRKSVYRRKVKFLQRWKRTYKC